MTAGKGVGKKGKHKKDEAENIKVIIRSRPLNQKEMDAGMKNAIDLDIGEGTVTVNHVCGTPDRWTFDAVVNNSFCQKDIFVQFIQPMVDSVLEGINATIFAYGQSGSGKTYTMSGGVPASNELQGIIPRSFTYIFNHIREKKNPNITYNLFCSYLELYNGKIRDLLAKQQVSLQIKETKDKTFYVHDLSQPEVKFVQDLMRHMEEGNLRRQVGCTELNADSSRSHSIFTVYIQMVENLEDGECRTVTSKLNLVDLAGSERQAKTRASGETLKEGCNINLSLSVLGTVIDTIVKGKGHVPFRSSPLTMLLKDSLGGNSKTCMFANINPADSNISETVSTLRFADRAKQIKNKPMVQMDAKDQKIQELQNRVADLTEKLKRYEEGDAPDLEEENELLEEKISTLETSVADYRQQVEDQTQEIIRNMKLGEEKLAASAATIETVQERVTELENEATLVCQQLSESESDVIDLRDVLMNFITNNSIDDQVLPKEEPLSLSTLKSLLSDITSRVTSLVEESNKPIIREVQQVSNLELISDSSLEQEKLMERIRNLEKDLSEKEEKDSHYHIVTKDLIAKARNAKENAEESLAKMVQRLATPCETDSEMVKVLKREIQVLDDDKQTLHKLTEQASQEKEEKCNEVTLLQKELYSKDVTLEDVISDYQNNIEDLRSRYELIDTERQRLLDLIVQSNEDDSSQTSLSAEEDKIKVVIEGLRKEVRVNTDKQLEKLQAKIKEMGAELQNTRQQQQQATPLSAGIDSNIPPGQVDYVKQLKERVCSLEAQLCEPQDSDSTTVLNLKSELQHHLQQHSTMEEDFNSQIKKITQQLVNEEAMTRKLREAYHSLMESNKTLKEKEVPSVNEEEFEKVMQQLSQKERAMALQRKERDACVNQLTKTELRLKKREESLQEARSIYESQHQVLEKHKQHEQELEKQLHSLKTAAEETEKHVDERLCKEQAKWARQVSKRIEEINESHEHSIDRKEEEIEATKRKLKKQSSSMQKLKEKFDVRVLETETLRHQLEELKEESLKRLREQDASKDLDDSRDEINSIIRASMVASNRLFSAGSDRRVPLVDQNSIERRTSVASVATKKFESHQAVSTAVQQASAAARVRAASFPRDDPAVGFQSANCIPPPHPGVSNETPNHGINRDLSPRVQFNPRDRQQEVEDRIRTSMTEEEAIEPQPRGPSSLNRYSLLPSRPTEDPCDSVSAPRNPHALYSTSESHSMGLNSYLFASPKNADVDVDEDDDDDDEAYNQEMQNESVPLPGKPCRYT